MLRKGNLGGLLRVILLAGLGAACSSGGDELSAQDLADRLSNALSFEDGDREDGAPPDGSDGADVAGILAVDVPSQVFGGQGFLVVLEVSAPSEAAAQSARVGIDGFDTRHYKTDVEFARWDPVAGRGTMVMTARLLDDGELHNHSFFLKAGLENQSGKLGRYKDFTINIEGACVSSTELCDQLDNDCDFSIDNGFDDLLTECKAGDPDSVCEARGLMRCSADGTTLECDADITEKDGQACEDGDWCTVDEACANGACAGGAARDCTSEDDACNTGTCDEATDACVGAPKADTVSCNDDSWCTINDHCDGAGACTGDPRDCSSVGDPCHPGTCNEDSDVCEAGAQLVDNASCGDSGEICLSGICDTHDCPTVDGHGCSAGGDQIEVCQLNGDGFRKWNLDTICTGEEALCDPVAFTCVECFQNANCNEGAGEICLNNLCGTHDCDPVDSKQCGASGDTVETCQLDGEGFRKWNTTETCSGGTGLCHTTQFTCVECEGDGDCNQAGGEVCLDNACGTHDCTTLTEQQCSATGSAVETCQADSDGFRKWVETETCEGTTPVCDDTSYTCVGCVLPADCAGQSVGDACENKTCVCGAGGSACSGDTPACRESDHTCVECAANSDCSGFDVCYADNSCGPMFPEKWGWQPGNAMLESVIVDDFDDDAQPDVLVLHADNNVNIWFNDNGDVFHQAPYAFPVDPSGLMNQPKTIATGDFNGNGTPDLAITDYGGDTFVAIHLNNGSGVFTGPQTFGMNWDSYQIYAVATGDFDGDGPDYDVDFAVVDSCTDGGMSPTGIRVFLNDGAGASFTESGCYGSSGTAKAMVAMDHDGDLDLDLAVLDDSTDDVMFYENNGSGVFALDEVVAFNDAHSMIAADLGGDSAQDLVVTSWFNDNFTVCINTGDVAGTVGFDCTSYGVAPFADPTRPHAFDYDGDLDLDLAVPCRTDSGLLIFENDGAGVFSLVDAYVTHEYPRAAAAGNLDLDPDGTQDLVVVNSSNEQVDHVRLLPNRGDGTFNAPLGTPADDEGYLDVADLDNDGDADVVYCERLGDQLVAYKSDGNGRLTRSFSTAVGDNPRRVKLANLDGDAFADAVVPNYSDQTVSVCLNNTGTMFSACQTLAFPSGNYPNFVAIGELTGDTHLDIAANSSGRAVVWANDGFGGFTEKVVLTTNSADALAIGDIDGDLLNDLVIIRDSGSDDLETIINPGGGDFDLATPVVQRFASTSVDPGDVLLKDTDGDDDLDIVITTFADEELWVFANDGAGVFDPDSPLKYPVSSLGCGNPYRMDLGDLDLDGDDDLVATCASTEQVVIFRQDPTRLTAFPYLAPAGTDPSSIGLGDFNKDGALDIGVANFDGHNIAVILNNMGL